MLFLHLMCRPASLARAVAGLAATLAAPFALAAISISPSLALASAPTQLARGTTATIAASPATTATAPRNRTSANTSSTLGRTRAQKEAMDKGTPGAPYLTASGLRMIDQLMGPGVHKARTTTATVRLIVLHYSSDVLRNPDNPYDPQAVIGTFAGYGVSAHYFVARDGTAYRLVDEKRTSYHAGPGKLPWIPAELQSENMNNFSVGIEIAGTGDKKDMAIFSGFDYDAFAARHPEHIGYTKAQYRTVSRLIDDIISRNPIIKRDRYHILGHSEVDPARKTDPGALFDYARIGLPATRSGPVPPELQLLPPPAPR